MGPSLSALKGGEGNAIASVPLFFRQVPLDNPEHAGKILRDLVIPKPDYAVAPEGYFIRASEICLILRRVLTAIDFKCELAGRAGEVDHVTTDRVLSAKVPFWKRLAESSP